MPLGNLVRQLTRDLWSQRLRTFLTIFGIVWGTAAVTLLLAFGEGLKAQQMKSFAGLGEYIVIAWPAQTSKPFEGLPKGRRIRLDDEDMQLLRDKVPHLFGVSEEYSQSLIVNWADKKRRIDVSGVAPIFGDLRNLIPAAGGRFVNDLDEASQRRTLFLGDELAKEIFGPQDPVGKVVTLNASPFTVVGVLKPKDQDSSYSGRDKNKAFIPASTFRTLTGIKYVDNFIFKTQDNSQTAQAKKDVLQTLAAKHRFDPTDEQVLGMWDTTEMFTFFSAFMLGFELFLGFVGVLTLVVGGIGVSNIMNVVVEERSREIGIKMALGAKPRSIMLQFLLETLLITALGGAVGFLITYGVCAVFPALGFTEYVGDPTVSPALAAITAALLGMIALVAGYFPARSAALLDPVVAMKL